MSELTRENPFHELYLSEAVDDPELYSRWFSPEIITGQTQKLFRKGNVVLRGSNGVGKTMLLRMFLPQVQAAYLKQEHELPVATANHQSLGIGINFIHAGFNSLGQRTLAGDPHGNATQWSLLVGDLLNYHLVHELLRTLVFLRGDGAIVAANIDVKLDADRLNEFAVRIATDSCWFGSLEGVDSFERLMVEVRERIEKYRSFVNWNRKSLPTSVTDTKTVVGVPLMQARKALDKCGIVPDCVSLMVTLDQYETLYHTDYTTVPDPEHSVGRAFCRVVNSLLALRNTNISYKVGVRHYAWGQESRGINTDARLELGRDYQIVDLDEILRRRENTKAWIFPKFASDVAMRRMSLTLGGTPEAYRGWFREKLESLTPAQEVEKYCRRIPDRLRPNEHWPIRWRRLLAQIYARSKYEAKLAEVWVAQQEDRGHHVLKDAPPDEPFPWTKPWWQKERREALLTQIASECRQRRLYCGWDTLLTLSASNILVFINLCQEIWDHWERAHGTSKLPPERMSADIQSQAVRIVAESWLDKQEEFPRGATRKNFVVRLGIAMRKAMIEDRGLVYPGRTGFSLLEEDLEGEAGTEVRTCLEEATDFGALVSLAHTTKEKDRKRRRKWYLYPILCPNFEIPAIKTKEPYYATLKELRKWTSSARPAIQIKPPNRKGSTNTVQRGLFDSVVPDSTS